MKVQRFRVPFSMICLAILLIENAIAFEINRDQVQVEIEMNLLDNGDNLKSLQDQTKRTSLYNLIQPRCIPVGASCDYQFFYCCDPSVCRCDLHQLKCFCRNQYKADAV